jgi:hypothetical protein
MLLSRAVRVLWSSTKGNRLKNAETQLVPVISLISVEKRDRLRDYPCDSWSKCPPFPHRGWFSCIIKESKEPNQPMTTFDFETEYHWGALMVKLVPMFCMDVYKASDDELVWVFDVNNPKNGYHVPARNLSTYSY